MKKIGRRVPSHKVRIYYGNKLKDLPPGFQGMYKITYNNMQARSKRNLDILSKRFNISWKDFYYYEVGQYLHSNRSYIVYGYIGKERFTYHVYKHAGQNIGDVFLRYDNGKRIVCSRITSDIFPELDLKYATKRREKELISQMNRWMKYLFNSIDKFKVNDIMRFKLEQFFFERL